AHLAVVFEIDPSRVENADRLLHALSALAERMSEVGECQHGDARLVTEPPRYPRGLDRYVGQILRRRHFCDRSVGDEDRSATGYDDGDADHSMTGLVVDYPPHLLESDREISSDAGHHRIGVPLRHHRRAEVIAVLIDQALTIPQQITFALQPFIEELRIKRVALGKPGVMHLDALVAEIEPRGLRCSPYAFFAADQNRGAETLIDEGIGGANDLFFFALGEHDAFRRSANAFDDPLHRAGDRVPPRRQLRLVCGEIDDRTAGHARGHRRFRHRDRHDMDEAGIERNGDDVLATEPRPSAT